MTHSKAWIEMTHRYLATGVGALIVVLAVWNWIAARRRMAGAAPGIAALTLVWVCLQGAFGALTVTMKLYPAIVTAASARRHRPAGAARLPDPARGSSPCRAAASAV